MPRSSRTARRAGEVLCLLAAHPHESFTAAELARRLGMSASSCHTVLHALLETGLVSRHPTSGLFGPAPFAMAVGEAARVRHPTIGIAIDHLGDLVDRLDLEGFVTVPAGGDVGVVAQLGRPRPYAMPITVGSRFRLAAPVGGLFVAWAGPERIAAWLARGGVSDHGQVRYLQRLLASARSRGYAVQLRPPSEAEHLRDALEALSEHPEVFEPDDARSPAVGGPAGHRVLLAGLEQTQLVHLDPGASYPVHSIASPVFDTSGHVCMVLYAVGFDGVLRADEVADIGERLWRVAQLVTRLGHGALPVDVTDGPAEGAWSPV